MALLRTAAAWMRDDTAAGGEEAIQVILDEHREALVDRDERYARIASLLQPFNQKRTETRFVHDVTVEVIALYLLRVGEDDLAHAQGGELSPQPSQHLWSRHGQQKIHTRPIRSGCFEPALERNRGRIDEHHRADAHRAIDDAHPHLVARRDFQYMQQMLRARPRSLHSAVTIDLRRLEQDQVQASPSPTGSRAVLRPFSNPPPLPFHTRSIGRSFRSKSRMF